MTFRNVPAFATHLDAPVEVPTLGTVIVDVAYGGMFYVIADAERFGLRLTPDEGADIVRDHRDDQGRRERAAAGRPPGAAGVQRDHHRAAVGAAARSGQQHAERGDGLDRDPRLGATRDLDRGDRPLAVRDRDLAPGWRRWHARGELRVGDAFRHEGILGTVFTGRLVEAAHGRRRIRPIVPTITGQAWITGFASYVVDPTDPFPDGFTVGDIWG